MTKAIAIVIALGLGIAVIGGVAGGGTWQYVGMVIVVAGVIALYGFGLLKNPLGVAKAEMQIEEQFSGYPPAQNTQPTQTIRAGQEQRPPAPSNSTPDPNARSSTDNDQPPSARAGERAR